MNRSAGNSPVARPMTMPPRLTTPQATRKRRTNPRVSRSPYTASGIDAHSTYRVHRWTSRYRYALRRTSVSPALRSMPSRDVITESGLGPARRARAATPNTPQPAAAAAATLRTSARSVRHACAAARARMGSPRRRKSGWAEPAAASRRLAATVPREVATARAVAAARNSAAKARLARYPAARCTAKVPASIPATTQVAQGSLWPAGLRTAPPLGWRTSAAAPSPTAAPSTHSIAERTAVSGRCKVPWRTSAIAGTPGRDTAESPSWPASRVHHRYTGPSGPTG